MDIILRTELAFAALGSEYPARKQTSEKAVCAWKWARGSWFDPRPLYFERHGWARGRQLRLSPVIPCGFVSCGLDVMERVVVERQFNEYGFYETFYRWSEDAVEVAHFDYTAEKRPINFLPPSPPKNKEEVVELMFERRGKGRRIMKSLDLRDDFADVYAYVVRRVSAFDPRTNNGPGDGGSIIRIDVGFGFEQSGWVAVVFDTRPGAGPDGEWNGYIDGNDLARTHWPAAANANENRALKIILADATERNLPPQSCDELAKLLGETLKGVLLKARADGVFADLPRAARCELGVEEQEGRYGWPEYETRWQENAL